MQGALPLFPPPWFAAISSFPQPDQGTTQNLLQVMDTATWYAFAEGGAHASPPSRDLRKIRSKSLGTIASERLLPPLMSSISALPWDPFAASPSQGPNAAQRATEGRQLLTAVRLPGILLLLEVHWGAQTSGHTFPSPSPGNPGSSCNTQTVRFVTRVPEVLNHMSSLSHTHTTPHPVFSSDQPAAKRLTQAATSKGEPRRGAPPHPRQGAQPHHQCTGRLFAPWASRSALRATATSACSNIGQACSDHMLPQASKQASEGCSTFACPAKRQDTPRTPPHAASHP